MLWSIAALILGVSAVLAGLAWVHPGFAVAACGSVACWWGLTRDSDSERRR